MAKAKKKRDKRRRHTRLIGEHGDALLALVLDFQLVEEGLKRYLERAFDLIRSRTSDLLNFGFDRSSVNDWPLGRLIDNFKKYSGDKQLAKDLEALRPYRNYCAHRAFMEIMFWRQHTSAPTLDTKKLTEIHEQLRDAGDRVVAHMSRLPSPKTEE